MLFGGVVAMHRDHGPVTRARAADRDEPAGIGLVEDERVGRRRRAEVVAVNAVGPVVVVQADIEKGARVARPYHRALRVRDRVGQVDAGRDVADGDRVEFRALVVDAPGEQRVVGARLGLAEVEERLALGQSVAVEQDGLGPAAVRLPADDLVLPVLAVPAVIVEGAVGDGDVAVLLLHPAAHLTLQARLKNERAREHGVGMGVLTVQHRADGGIEGGGLAQHLLPVGGTQPGVGIVDRDAVDDAQARSALGRLGRRYRGKGGHAVRPRPA